jgi:hypothetical protein
LADLAKLKNKVAQWREPLGMVSPTPQMGTIYIVIFMAEILVFLGSQRHPIQAWKGSIKAAFFRPEKNFAGRVFFAWKLKMLGV